MFDRFTDRAKKSMNLARVAAQRQGHDYLGTEHILLGLLDEGGSIAIRVLKELDVEPRAARSEVEKRIARGSHGSAPQLPFTSRAKKTLELAMEEAEFLQDIYIGSEHLLLGLVKEQDGVAGQALRALGVTLDTVHEKLRALRQLPEYASRPADEGAGVQVGPLTRSEYVGVLKLARNVLVQIGETDAARAVDEVVRRIANG